MSTIAIPLPKDLDEFVQEQVKSGKFATQEEAVSALAQTEMRRQQQLEWLRREVARGRDQAERGEFVEFSAEDVIRRGRALLAAKQRSE